MLQVDAGNADGGRHWLLIEWPDGEKAPTHYTLPRLRKAPSRKQLVRITKERWRTDRTSTKTHLKGELGLDHYEGRSLHPVGITTFTVVLCCYAFVTSERLRHFSPLAREGRVLLTRSTVRPKTPLPRTPLSPRVSPSRASSFDGFLDARAVIAHALSRATVRLRQ